MSRVGHILCPPAPGFSHFFGLVYVSGLCAAGLLRGDRLPAILWLIRDSWAVFPPPAFLGGHFVSPKLAGFALLGLSRALSAAPAIFWVLWVPGAPRRLLPPFSFPILFRPCLLPGSFLPA